MTSLYSLIYQSSSKGPISKKMVGEILEVSVRNNLRVGITGVLAIRSNYFVQYLEGPEDYVKRCFQRISDDNRHTVRWSAPMELEKRRFSKWSMGLVREGDSQTESLTDLWELMLKGEDTKTRDKLTAVVNRFSIDMSMILA